MVDANAKAFLEFLKGLTANRTKDEEGIIAQLEVVVGKPRSSHTHLQLADLFKNLIDSILKRNPIFTNKQDGNGFTMLHHASLLGYVRVVELLLQKGASTAIEDINGAPPMAYAEKGGHDQIVSMLLEPQQARPVGQRSSQNVQEFQKCKELIQRKDLAGLEAALKAPNAANIEDKAGTTLAQVASFVGSLEALKLLVSKGGNLNNKDNDGVSCVHKAVIGGHLECLKFLVENGAKVDVADNDGLSPLHHACYHGKVELARLLVERNANVNVADNERLTPLHHSVSSGQLEIVECLVQHGANVNAQDSKGATPLHIAAYENHLKCVTVLIASGASLNAKDAEGLTPIHHACFLGHTDIAKLILEKGQKALDVNDADITGSTPVHKACFYGHLECVKLLLSRGAKVNFPDGTTSPLHHAAFGGHSSCIDILLKNGANPNCIDSERATPLHKAAFSGHLEAVRMLVDYGAEILVQDEEGSTPLHKAAFSGQAKVVQYLLENGAEVDCQDSDDGTPLHNACFNGHLECVRILLANQANLNCADDKGASPLHLSVLNGHKEVAALLVRSGSQVDSPDDRGMTAMHHAIAHTNCLQFLLDSGAEVDCKDRAARTPLFYAAKNSCEEPARFLIVKGADLYVKDSKGQTPFDVAKPSFQKVLLSALYEKEQQVDADTQKKYQAAVKLFNQNRKKGIEYLIEKQIITGLPEEIVKFLHTAENLDKGKIGELIGEGDQHSLKLLELFVDYMDFSGLDFDDALRHFMSKFRLPGEAQKIDRIMERFAARYCRNNPGVFSHEDTAYIVAFSLIMLNTDAHSPHIKNKMTKEEFIKNNRGITGGDSLPKGYLESLYDKIVQNEIKMESDGSMFGSAERKGWVKKQGGRIKTWKKRYLVLKNNCLYYFKKDDNTADPCGIIPLENLLVRAVELKGHKHVFELYSQTGEIKSCKWENGVLVKGHHGSYLVSAHDKQTVDSWVAAIRNNIAFNPLFEIIKKRMEVKIKKDDSVDEKMKGFDFQDLHDACLMCSMAYKSQSAVKEAYGMNTNVVEDNERGMRYFLLTNERSKSQTIVLCGSVPESSTLGAAVTKKVDVFTTFGFDKAADQIDNTLVKFLKRDYSLSLYGHSLGAALAVLFGLHLHTGGYKIDRVITFGQPKIVKDKEMGAYKPLPLTRVIDYNDPVPSLFSGYSHVGQEIVLFSDSYYSMQKEHGLGVSPDRSYNFNHAESYLRNISKKLKAAVQIPYEERNQPPGSKLT